MLKSIDVPQEAPVIPPMIPDVPKELPKAHSNLPQDIVKSIEETILDHSPNITWNDIKGLEDVKKMCSRLRQSGFAQSDIEQFIRTYII